MTVHRLFGVDLQAGAKLSDMLVKRGLEPAFAKPAALQPLGRERLHARDEIAHREIRRTQQLERPRGAPALR